MTNLGVYVLAATALLGSLGAASAQDAALGEKVFLKCKACHQIGEGAKDAVGPVLNGVVGRKAGTYLDYSYSDANKNSGVTWDVAALKEYLKKPSRQGSRHQDDFPRRRMRTSTVSSPISSSLGPTVKSSERRRFEPIDAKASPPVRAQGRQCERR